MKYGLIVHNYGEYANKAVGFNIGDPIQSVILKKLYKEMNIPDDQIIEIDQCHLSQYDGEYVLLPMIGVAIGVGFAPLPLSYKIIPVFISSHFVISDLSEEMVLYLKNYGPIGCRDEYSLNTMRRYGIPAYLSGCITVLFKKRTNTKLADKIYLIDVPDSLKKYIPQDILKNSEYYTHLLPLDKKVMSHTEAKKLYKIAEQRLIEYRKKAGLVVSSRMHALVPCMAMGIPVIAVFDNLSYRFSWLDKYIKLHIHKDFKNINWYPKPIEFETEKARIKDLVISVINDAYKKYSKMYDISNFYETRNRAVYCNKYYSLLMEIEFESDKFNYVIWGCGLIGNNVYDIMKNLYPKANLIAAVDEFMTGKWHGVDIIKSKDLEKYNNAFIVLATYSGKQQGYEVMKKLGKVENKDFVYLGTING